MISNRTQLSLTVHMVSYYITITYEDWLFNSNISLQHSAPQTKLYKVKQTVVLVYVFEFIDVFLDKKTISYFVYPELSFFSFCSSQNGQQALRMVSCRRKLL